MQTPTAQPAQHATPPVGFPIIPPQPRPPAPGRGKTLRSFRPRAFGTRLHRVLSAKPWRYPVLMIAVLALATSGILLWRYQAGAMDYRDGAVADRTIKANRQVQYVSASRTLAAKRTAIEDPTHLVYVQDPRIADTQVRRLDAFLVAADEARRDGPVSPEAFRARIAGAAPPNFSAASIATLYTLEPLARVRVGNAARQTLRTILADRKVFPGNEAALQVQLNINNVVSTDLLTGPEATVTLDLLRSYVVPNMVTDSAETRAAQAHAAAAVPDVTVTLLQGEVVVREGEIVTPEAMEKMQALGLRAPNLNTERVFGLLGMVAALLALLGVFLVRGVPGGWRGSQVLLLLFALISVTALARFLLPGHPVSPYLFPIAGVGMVLALLISTEIAFASTVYLALLAAFVTESLAFGTMFLVTGLVGVVLAERAQSTVAFLWSAAIIAVVGMAVAISWGLLSGASDVLGLAQRAGFAALNGVFSAGLAWLGVTLLARLFGIVTPFQLLELGHPRQPLLARLGQEAPGTYYHSMIVGNLAEKAVEAIGGDPLLTRVAVWYHDIGKALHPGYFIENQGNTGNVHDTLNPHTSARVIINHVRDGVALAEQYRLPQPIIDVIAQHHGTMRMDYFYRKAQQRDGDATDAADFAYPGPIPQSKEAAVVMLADATEAATRAANRAGKLNPPAGAVGADAKQARTAVLRRIIENIVKERMAEGQLAEAPITLHDLTTVQRTFVTVLDGMYHPRIEYPEPGGQSGTDPATVTDTWPITAAAAQPSASDPVPLPSPPSVPPASLPSLSPPVAVRELPTAPAAAVIAHD